MKCLECGNEVTVGRGILRLLDEIAGMLILENAEFAVCERCGTRVYSGRTASRIGEKRKRMIAQQLRQLPVGQFVTARQAASILGISKQAFSKNRRITAGFVYSTQLGKRSVYLRSSVEMFGETGDGRFSLWKYAADGVRETIPFDETEEVCIAPVLESARYVESFNASDPGESFGSALDSESRFTTPEVAYA